MNTNYIAWAQTRDPHWDDDGSGPCTASTGQDARSALLKWYAELDVDEPRRMGILYNTAANLATGLFRRYLLLVDANDVFTVQPSYDAATAAGCTWAARPAAGLAILGIVTIQNASGADFIPATTLLGAAGITTTVIDGYDDSVIMASQVTP
jgi:hypothetical protein